MPSRFKILHISDLHFGKIVGHSTEFKHGFRLENGISQFVKYCVQNLNAHNCRPDFIVVSGDLVSDGSDPEQHKTATKNLRELCNQLNFKDLSKVFIVPGNHDVDRNSHWLRRMFNHNQYVLADFYSSLPNEIRDKYILPVSFGSASPKTFRKRKWILEFSEYKVAFILLYSPITSMNALIPPKRPKTTKPWRNYDRGLITQTQIQQVDDEIRDINQDYLKIAVFHHNPLPILRPGQSVDSNNIPEWNLLANGPEIIHTLTEWGVSLVLHGHRHQNAVLASSHESPLTVVGAPSAGLSSPSLIYRIPHTKEKHAPIDWVGFNCIDIKRTNFGSSVKFLQFREQAGSTISYSLKKSKTDLKLYLPIASPIEILSSEEGINILAKHLMNSIKGATILHYHIGANWSENKLEINPTGNLTPFSKLWTGVIEDKMILEALTTKIFGTLRGKNEIERIRELINESLNSGHYLPEFIDLLHNNDIYLNCNNDDNSKFPLTSFEKHINEIQRSNGRWKNYAIELLRVALHQNFQLNKCVYFWRDNRGILLGDSIREQTREKFVWLINSLLIYRGIYNCRFAWLPFAFSKNYTQNFVSIDPSTPSNGDSPSIIIGWETREDDFDLEGRDIISVVEMSADYPESEPAGDLGRDIRTLLTKLIYPLTEYLMKNFSIFKDNTLYWGNLNLIGKIFDCEDLLPTNLEQQFEEAGTNIMRDPTIDTAEINNCNKWLTEKLDTNLPYQLERDWTTWDPEDFEFLIEKLSKLL